MSTKAIIRWAGSKRQLVPALIASMPLDFTRYVEPFAGSACLFFALKPAKALLSDVNQVLINTYKSIQEAPVEISRIVESIEVSNDEYYRQRSLFEQNDNTVETAARFLYLNRHCFNGVYRTNRDGRFNVPRGSKTGTLPTEREFVEFSNILNVAEIRCGDFEACLAHTTAGDMVYMDPPYATKSGKTSGEYGPGSFEVGDIDRLISCLNSLDDKGVRFLVSYSKSELLTDRLRPKWNVKTVQAYRHVSGFAHYRGIVEEVFVSNYEAPTIVRSIDFKS